MLSVAPSSRWQITRSGLVTSMSPVVAIWPAVTSPGPVAESWSRFGAFAFHLQRDLLHVEDDVGDVLADAGEARELVQHALDLDRGDRGALERGEQHAAQRVAERQAEAALERLGDERWPCGGVAAGLRLEAVGFFSSCQFFALTASLVLLPGRWRIRWPATPEVKIRSGRRHLGRPGRPAEFRRGGAWTGARRCAGSASRRGSR